MNTEITGVLPCPVYAVLRIKPRASLMLEKYSTNGATYPAPQSVFNSSVCQLPREGASPVALLSQQSGLSGHAIWCLWERARWMQSSWAPGSRYPKISLRRPCERGKLRQSPMAGSLENPAKVLPIEKHCSLLSQQYVSNLERGLSDRVLCSATSTVAKVLF